MEFLFLLVGLVIGGAVGNFSGALFGATLGYGFGELLSIRKRLKRIEDKLVYGGPAEPTRVVTSPPAAEKRPPAEPPPEPIRPAAPIPPLRPKEPEHPPWQPTGGPAARPIALAPGSPIYDAVAAFFTGGNTPLQVRYRT